MTVAFSMAICAWSRMKAKNLVVCTGLNAAGINQSKRTAIPVRLPINAVPGHAGVSSTMERRFPISLLNSMDLPTFGRPTMATMGFDISISSLGRVEHAIQHHRKAAKTLFSNGGKWPSICAPNRARLQGGGCGLSSSVRSQQHPQLCLLTFVQKYSLLYWKLLDTQVASSAPAHSTSLPESRSNSLSSRFGQLPAQFLHQKVVVLSTQPRQKVALPGEICLCFYKILGPQSKARGLIELFPRPPGSGRGANCGRSRDTGRRHRPGPPAPRLPALPWGAGTPNPGWGRVSW